MGDGAWTLSGFSVLAEEIEQRKDLTRMNHDSDDDADWLRRRDGWMSPEQSAKSF